MKPSDAPEGVDLDLVEAIKRGVDLEGLIQWRYKHLWDELVTQMACRHMRLASPFGPPGNKALIVFDNSDSEEERQELHWADPLAPSSVPRNVIGFVQAQEGCSYKEAVVALAELLPTFQRLDALADEVCPPIAHERSSTRRRIEAAGGRSIAPQRRKQTD